MRATVLARTHDLENHLPTCILSNQIYSFLSGSCIRYLTTRVFNLEGSPLAENREQIYEALKQPRSPEPV